jgi:peptidoglycan hydrolase CwlO-like protein
MEELGEYDKEYKKKQEELFRQQQQFEEQQKQLQEMAPELEKKRKTKDIIISWATIVATILFLGFLAYKLLF